MKFNIANPVTGCQKSIVIDDDKKVAIFFDKKLGNEVPGESMGDQYKGYIFRITGGNDKDGFPMKQGVMVKGRVRLLLSKGHSTYRPRRAGERKRKSVRGCIVGPDLAALFLTIVKVGDQDIEGLTDEKKPRRLGPKRANHIRKLFNLKKEDDVRLYVVRRKIEKEGKKTRIKSPKIQRLITDQRIRRKRIYLNEKKARWQKTKNAWEKYRTVVDEYKKKQAAQAAKKAEAKAEATGKKAPVETKVPAKKTTAKNTTRPKDVQKGKEAQKGTETQKGKATTTQAKKQTKPQATKSKK